MLVAYSTRSRVILARKLGVKTSLFTGSDSKTGIGRVGRCFNGASGARLRGFAYSDGLNDQVRTFSSGAVEQNPLKNQNLFAEMSSFFQKIASLTIWRRLFYWKRYRQELFHAGERLRSMEIDNRMLVQKIVDLEARVEETTRQSGALSEKLATLKAAEIERDQAFQSKLNLSSDIIEALKQQKEQIENEAAEAATKRARRWQIHEENVKQTIKKLCMHHSVKYVDNPGLGGLRPDNVVEIGNKYYIFDAKSPRNADTSYFKGYLKSQSEAAGKYAKLSSDVHADIFLVVPSDTLGVVADLNLSRSMGAFTITILSEDGIEPTLLLLKQIHEIESCESVSPQDQDQMVKVIGNLSHIIKRNIQVNQFFINKELKKLLDLEKALSILPKTIQEKIHASEASNAGPSNNPKMDKKGTMIKVDDLVFESGKQTTKSRRLSLEDVQDLDQADDSNTTIDMEYVSTSANIEPPTHSAQRVVVINE